MKVFVVPVVVCALCCGCASGFSAPARRTGTRRDDSLDNLKSTRRQLDKTFSKLPVLPYTAEERLKSVSVVVEEGQEEEKSGNQMLWKASILAITACWGTNFATIKYGMSSIPGDEHALFVFARFLAATVALSPFLFQSSSKDVVWKGVRIGAWCASGYAAQAMALGMGASASSTAFECSLQTVVVAAFYLLTNGGTRRDVMKSLGSAGLAVAGVAALSFLSADADAGGSQMGSLVALGQAVGFGASYIELESAVEEHPEDSLPLAALQCATIAAASGAAALFESHSLSKFFDDASHFVSTAQHDTPVLVSLAWLGLVSTALTIWLQALAFKEVKASDASLILTSEPLWAAATAHVLLGETFGFAQYAGATLILCAVLLNDGLLDDVIFSDEREQQRKVL